MTTPEELQAAAGIEFPPNIPALIRELHTLSGFTWGQLGAILDVPPSTLHLWQLRGTGVDSCHRESLEYLYLLIRLARMPLEIRQRLLLRIHQVGWMTIDLTCREPIVDGDGNPISPSPTPR